MSYKERFQASANRAHYQNIATKILREMSSLRSMVENSQSAPRRWVWELIQNAKDVRQDNGIDIIIDYNPLAKESFLSFKHTGKPFSADNIRFLIEQISSKDRSNDEVGKRKTTGKFGTGFLTTHLLSETVKVNGIAKEPELDYRKFSILLDRTGYDLPEITDAVQKAKDSVENLDEYPIYHNYIEGNYNTEFIYPLIDTVSLDVVNAGLSDLRKCLPYTLAFVKDICSVEVERKIYKNTSTKVSLGEGIELVSINIPNEGNGDDFSIVLLNKNFTTIAIPVEKLNETINLLSLEKGVPRLFCDFPLVGTEKFAFPAIINNPNFNPTDARDGIFLTTSQRINPPAEDNKEYILEAVELYHKLLDFASEKKWGNLYLLAQIKPTSEPLEWVDENWYRDNILKPIRDKILITEIVNNVNEQLVSIKSSDKSPYVWFPNSSYKDLRHEIWSLGSCWFPHCLPQETHIEVWNQLIWKDCDKLNVDVFASFVEQQKSLENLGLVLNSINEYDWLNRFYLLIKREVAEYDTIINNRAIFPNQYGVFKKKSQLLKDDGTFGDDFKDILFELGNDIRNSLIDDELVIEFEEEKIRNQAYAVREIITSVTEKTNDRENSKNYLPAFRKILLWFQNNPTKAKELFPTLVRSKHLLYDDEEILSNLAKAEELGELLNDFQLTDISAIRELITKYNQNSTKSLLPITEKILTDYGITSIIEWEKAIQNKNLAELFSHESVPTTDMFMYVQGLIKQAKKNIIIHLETLPCYDLTNLDDTTAPTTLAGIIKDGREISIIIRPAYNGEVIIYYGSERDILDYEDYELWIDDGIMPKQITLGHILKSAEIIKFPI